MEIVLLSFLIGYLIISFLQARKEEQEEQEYR
jgi:general stress protein CsbA